MPQRKTVGPDAAPRLAGEQVSPMEQFQRDSRRRLEIAAQAAYERSIRDHYKPEVDWLNEHLHEPKKNLGAHQFEALVLLAHACGVAGLDGKTDPNAEWRQLLLDADTNPKSAFRQIRTLLDEFEAGKDSALTEMDTGFITLVQSLWLNSHAQMLSPKLRMITNGDAQVNSYRSLIASSVKSTPADTADASLQTPNLADSLLHAKSYAHVHAEDVETDDEAKPPPKGLRKQDAKITVSCFVHLTDKTDRDGIEIMELSIEQIDRLRLGEKLSFTGSKEDPDGTTVLSSKSIAYMEPGSALAPPKPFVGDLVDAPTEPMQRILSPRRVNGSVLGKILDDDQDDFARKLGDVVIGVIDVGGFDFTHEDFIDEDGNTRFLAIWDQGLEDLNDPAAFLWFDKKQWSAPDLAPDKDPVPVSFGAVYTTEDLNEALPCKKLADYLNDLDAAVQPGKTAGDAIRTIKALNKAAPEAVSAAFRNELDRALDELTDFVAVDLGDVVRVVEEMKKSLERKVPRDYIPQSAEIVGSHATHVASIAGGNHGVCPKAHLVGVSVAVATGDEGRRLSFYDSTRLGQAIDFIVDVAKAKDLPVVINISLGTNGHAHDGTSPINKWIESTLREPGRVVCVAAGNSGQETAEYENDIGYMSGRIHASGKVAAKDLVAELGWQVVGNGIVDVSENEMEIWYNPGDEFAIQVRDPAGRVTEWVHAGVFVENYPMAGSDTYVSIYNERFMHANGANRCSVFLSPKYQEPVVGVEPGVWTVRLRGERIRDGSFHAWIERDDPRPLGRLGESTAWNCPSFFTLDSNIDSSSVNSLGCGASVIAVANAKPRGDKIHPTSSQGPTRDGRTKPDIAAPGTDIVAAKGFGPTRDKWTQMTGTSMASPYAAGVAANMLRVWPDLTARQVLGLMQSTAQPLPGTDYAWRDDSGFGVLDAVACLDEVDKVMSQNEQRTAVM